MILVLHIIFSIVFTYFAILYMQFHFSKSWTWHPKTPIVTISNIFIAGSILIFAICMSDFYPHEVGLVTSIKFLLLLSVLYLMAIIDFREKIIPNELVLFLIAFRLLLIPFESYYLTFSKVFPPSLFGLLIGGGLIFLAMILSKNSIGAGDAKMFAVLGFYIGGLGIVAVLFYTFVFSAITSILLILVRRLSLKDTIPLAPFTLLGTLVYIFTNMS